MAAASEFARRRVARIYSGYWPFFWLALAVFAWTRPDHLAGAQLVPSFWLWPQPFNLNLLELSWTLSFVLYFYALFTLLVWLCPTQRRMAACALALVALGGFNLLRHFAWDGFGNPNLYLIPFWDQFLTSPFIVEFLAGALLAWWLQARPNGPAWTWLLLGVGLFAGGAWLSETWYDGKIEQGFHLIPRVAVFGGAAVLMVAGLVRLEARGRCAPRRLSLLGGGASYAIYLSHVPLLFIAQGLGLQRWVTGLPDWAAALVWLGLVIAIIVASMAFYRWLERPLHRTFRRALRV
jgi:peptidoglycan/LPS O-acetylase OafA/YrhL